MRGEWGGNSYRIHDGTAPLRQRYENAGEAERQAHAYKRAHPSAVVTVVDRAGTQVWPRATAPRKRGRKAAA